MKTDYQSLWKILERRGASPGVLSNLKRIAARWAKEKR